MNEIAEVEFETNLPSSSTPTASAPHRLLILIDAVTNATVGAAMIREILSAPRRVRNHHCY